MAWNVNVDEGAAPQLSSFPPSFGESLKASVGSTFNENVSVLGYDYLQKESANKGAKLPKEDAESMVKGAGVKLTIPEDGYTQEALSMLIKRQQDHMTRQSVMDRTPWSWLGSPTRGAAMLLTGLTDPLNVASAFIPVVGEARAAAMMAKATGAFGRAGVRASVGAVEGAVGAAVLEPAVYGFHQNLQDDYKMTDSLVNLAFGTVFGGGLHVVGGAVGDAMRAPMARSMGLETETAGKSLDAPPGLKSDPSSVAMARPTTGAEPPPAAAILRAVSPEAREAALRTAVADMANGRMPDVEAVVRFDQASAPKDVWFTGAPEAIIKTRTLEEQSARSNANEQFAGPGHYTTTSRDLAGTYGGPTGRVYEVQTPFSNPFDFNAVENRQSGKTRYEAMVEQLGSKTAANAELQRQGYDAIIFTSPRGERIANIFQSRNLVDAGPARAPKPPMQELRLVDDVVSSAERQQAPDSVAIGSPEASKAADTRLAEAHKEHALESAQAELTDAMSRISELQKNLELGGADPAKLERMMEGLKLFDEAIKDAANIGKAIVQNAICGLRS